MRRQVPPEPTWARYSLIAPFCLMPSPSESRLHFSDSDQALKELGAVAQGVSVGVGAVASLYILLPLPMEEVITNALHWALL